MNKATEEAFRKVNKHLIKAHKVPMKYNQAKFSVLSYILRTIFTQSVQTDRPEQTMKTQIWGLI